MFQNQQRSKKTLVNQLNVDGSSDNRRLNADVLPSIAAERSTNPLDTLPAAVNLGSVGNPWRVVHTDALNTVVTRFAEASRVATGQTPTGAPEGSNINRSCYWMIDDTNVPTTRKVFRWNGSTWQDWTANLIPGQTFYLITNTVGGERQLYIYTGPLGGLKKTAQLS